MRLISKFKDYYDSVGRVATDMKVLYIRNTKDGSFIDINHSCHPYHLSVHSTYPRYSARIGKVEIPIKRSNQCISFCGTPFIYDLITVEDGIPARNGIGMHTDHTVLLASVSASTNDVLAAHYGNRFVPRRSPRSRFYHKQESDNVSKQEAFMKIDWDTIHKQENCPVLTVRNLTADEGVGQGVGLGVVYNKIYNYRYRLVHNPILNDLKFATIIDPYTAFMTIDSYISGVLGQDAQPMVELSDKDILLKHGFDPKWGFRKQPESMR